MIEAPALLDSQIITILLIWLVAHVLRAAEATTAAARNAPRSLRRAAVSYVRDVGRFSTRLDLLEEMDAVRPRLRGVLHQYAFFVSLVFGGALVVGASGASEHVSASVFAAALATMFGVSALYHRITWRPGPRRWMRRLDHAAIYLLIAGTYTPFVLIVLSGAWRWTLLPIVWGGALAAILLKLAWVDGPKWLAAAIAIALGWMDHRPPATLGPHGSRRRPPTRGRRCPLHGRSGRVRERPAGSESHRLRLPRGLPRACDRGGRVSVRGRRRDPLGLDLPALPRRAPLGAAAATRVDEPLRRDAHALLLELVLLAEPRATWLTSDCCSGRTSVMPVLSRPARAVRPTRCV